MTTRKPEDKQRSREIIAAKLRQRRADGAADRLERWLDGPPPPDPDPFDKHGTQQLLDIPKFLRRMANTSEYEKAEESAAYNQALKDIADGSITAFANAMAELSASLKQAVAAFDTMRHAAEALLKEDETGD